MSVFIDRSLSLGLENTKINTNKIPVAADDHQILINVHGQHSSWRLYSLMVIIRIETNIKQIYSYFENPDSFCKVRNIFLSSGQVLVFYAVLVMLAKRVEPRVSLKASQRGHLFMQLFSVMQNRKLLLFEPCCGTYVGNMSIV